MHKLPNLSVTDKATIRVLLIDGPILPAATAVMAFETVCPPLLIITVLISNNTIEENDHRLKPRCVQQHDDDEVTVAIVIYIRCCRSDDRERTDARIEEKLD